MKTSSKISSEIIDDIRRIIPDERVLVDEPLSNYTSFRIGGTADVLAKVSTEQELEELLRYVSEEDIPHFLIGNGSNLLVSDDGYRGVMIRLEGEFEAIALDAEDPTVLEAGSAKLLSGTSAFAASNGLAGIEFASGIPGSVGGAMYMNAGAYGGEMKDIVARVRLIAPDGSGTVERTVEEMEFGYRDSAIQTDGMIVTKVWFKLNPDREEDIRARMAELAAKRNSKQPVEFPSAGSTFKRPVGGYAAALIEEAGLKGTSVGGAEVSTKHSGFVINKGGATCNDVINLMRIIIDSVKENSGITLEPEVRIIGDVPAL